MNQAENYCRVIKRMSNRNVLPPAYLQVDYLQSSGTQYIKIGSLANHQYFDLDLEVVAPVNNTFYQQYRVNGILGSNAYNSNTDVKVWYSSSNAYLLSINNVKMGEVYNALGNRYRIYLSPTITLCDGLQINTNTTTAITATANCFVFAINSNPSTPIQSAIKLYRLKTSSIDLYPCYRISDNKPGMYDIVNNTFYTNAGTGEFTIGNNV